ncbi:MAG: DNA replication/repair protein RecF [Bacteroidales bacterium]|nr:DNA replication/repair protein RecF [Bacteroidales bacterium]
MTLDRLSLVNFKNYAQIDVELCPNVNCFVGNNGVGKTNLLDAVYYLSFCKSYLNPIDTQNIRHGEDFFAIHGDYGELKVSCVLKRGQPKQMRVGKKTYHALSEHIGRIPLVIVSPSDQNLIIGGSEARRRFVDGVISQSDSGYLNHLLQYNKALDQRNRLLKQMFEDRQWDEPSVLLWDEQLVRHGQFITQGRQQFMTGFVPLFNDYFNFIADGREQVRVSLDTQAGDLSDLLLQARQADRYAQYTTVGPHKDDLEFIIMPDMPVKRFGSQGQQKTFLLALKLAQFEYIYKTCGMKPILLLDDIFDKLDINRVRQLVQLVAGDRFGQVLLTDTQPGRVEAIFDDLPNVEHRIFDVANDGTSTLITISQ